MSVSFARNVPSLLRFRPPLVPIFHTHHSCKYRNALHVSPAYFQRDEWRYAGEVRTLIMRWVGLRECPARIWGSSLSTVTPVFAHCRRQPLARDTATPSSPSPTSFISLEAAPVSTILVPTPPLPQSPTAHPPSQATPIVHTHRCQIQHNYALAELKPHWLLRLSPIRSANTPLTTLIMHIILAAIYMRMVIHMQYTCA